MNTLHIRAGQIIGRDHILRQANSQDGYALIETEKHVVGIVCDGCGDGKHSEVGAKLAANYLAGQATDLLAAGHLIEEIPNLLYPRMVQYLENLISLTQPRDRLAFLREHLLFTIVGIILTDDDGVIFTAGDGIYAVDSDVCEIDQNNEPIYIAYGLIDPSLLGGLSIPNCFEVQRINPDWQQVMISSDGFETELFPEIWGLAHPRALQRKLNFWSNQEHRLRDDTTLIAIEKVDTHASDDQQ